MLIGSVWPGPTSSPSGHVRTTGTSNPRFPGALGPTTLGSIQGATDNNWKMQDHGAGTDADMGVDASIGSEFMEICEDWT